MNNQKHFKVSARTLKSLGRDSIKDRFTAILEIVKNSYDADATNVYIEINARHQIVTITDDGVGMSADDFDTKWLVIGTSEKILNSTSNSERRRLGEKGIGRLSCARLGDKVNLRSIHNHRYFEAHIDWKEFDDPDKSLDEIFFDFKQSANQTLPNFPKIEHGLQVEVSNLIENWEKQDIETLENEIKNLFTPSIKDQVFNIHLKTDLVLMYDGGFQQLLHTGEDTYVPEIEVAFNFNPNKKNEFVVVSRLSGEEEKYSYEIDYSNDKDADLIGPFNIQLGYYATTTESLVILNQAVKVNTIRNFLKNNYGIRVFRDSVRVKPYGDPRHSAGDWLQLGRRRAANPAGVGRESYTMDVFNIIGRIEITADENPLLEDNASREGLQDTIVYRKLKNILIDVIKKMEVTRHTEYILYRSPKKIDNKPPIDHFISSLRGNVKVAIENSQASINKDGSPNEEAISQVQGSLIEIEQTIPRLEEFVNESVLFRSLASVGIISTVFAHEVKGDLTDIGSTLSLSKSKIKPHKDADLQKLLPLIDESNKRIQKVEMWSQLTLNRVHIDKRKRKKVDLKEAVTSLSKEFEGVLNFFEISLEVKIKEFEVRAFQMEIDSIFVNLLTNAIYACRQSSKKERKISISGKIIDNKYVINFEDNGIGIPKENLNKIWLPLYTTKKEGDGTGLGLTIVKNTINDLSGNITAQNSPNLGGALFVIEFNKG